MTAPAPRRRASERAGGLRAAVVGRAAAPRDVADEPGGGEQARPVAKPSRAEMTKYTALLDEATGTAFEELALIARRQLGRRVDKSQLLRALILLTADDVSLRDQVIDQVRRA